MASIIAIIAGIASSSGDGGSVAKPIRPGPTPTFAEAKAEARQVSYDNLFRNNERYIGATVCYEGKVVQVIEGAGDNYNLRVEVTRKEYSWEDTVFLYYSGDRLLENDIIEFVG